MMGVARPSRWTSLAQFLDLLAYKIAQRRANMLDGGTHLANDPSLPSARLLRFGRRHQLGALGFMRGLAL